MAAMLEPLQSTGLVGPSSSFWKVAVTVFAVLWPLANLFAAQRAEIDETAQLVSLYRTEIALRPGLTRELASLRRREAKTAGLLHGSSAALAAADMQRIVKQAIEQAGGQLRSAQNLPTSVENGLETIEVPAHRAT